MRTPPDEFATRSRRSASVRSALSCSIVLPFILAMVVTMAWDCRCSCGSRTSGCWWISRAGARYTPAPVPRVGGLAMALGVLVAAAGNDLTCRHPDRWFLLAAAMMIVRSARTRRSVRSRLPDQAHRADYRRQHRRVSRRRADSLALTLDDSIPLPGWIVDSADGFFPGRDHQCDQSGRRARRARGRHDFLCLCAVALLSSIGESGNSTALALTFAGAVLGFLRFNTYPASVFMGDAGSQMLGFAIGVLSIRATQSLERDQRRDSGAASGPADTRYLERDGAAHRRRPLAVQRRQESHPSQAACARIRSSRGGDGHLYASGGACSSPRIFCAMSRIC
jgi:hypothetical protein